MRQPNYPTQGMERAQPVLGHQPPLPGTAVVRYIQTNEEHHDGAMVPVNYYGEDENEQLSLQASVSMYPQETQTFVPEAQYQMDHNTLWFIANGMAKQRGLKGQDHTSRDHLQQLLQDHAKIAERITGLGIAHIQEKIGHR